MSWAASLPQELLCRPTGLVVLTGLDVTYNAVHKAIWDSFCNNRRSDRLPLQFRVMEGDHEYPKSSKKRTSYEWYIPKGILKTGWMRKHLCEIPAVVVIFFDLDWDEPMWKERQMECSTRIQIVKNSLGNRGTKIAVTLIQKNAPLPPGEDVMAAERAASLCSACDISAKSLYVLPHTDHLMGYTIRLENAFYELTQSYYHAEGRKVKAHKDFLNKTTHQLLFVRHQFKIAFFNELKQDSHTALKHYKQAYAHILELRMSDYNLLEVKVNAGFVNYKICRLCFQHNAPLDAINQFRRHIDFFKDRVGVADLAFEHSAWMSRQFQLFGDLFDEAIKLGLTAIQTQHPGFYYQQAAQHAISRKLLCHGLCFSHQGEALKWDPLENLDKLDFFGQRPWRQHNQSFDPPDMQREHDGILALQQLERKTEHSALINPLLGSAVSQFKKYKSPRMKRSLMVQMGEEYFHAKDYNKALILLSKVLWEYRSERWWVLLTSILQLCLKCAFLTCKVQDYVSICMELIACYSVTGPEDKLRLQLNMLKVLSGKVPDAEPGLDQECVEKARLTWQQEASSTSTFTIDMQNLAPFVECKVRFIGDKAVADSLITVEVCMRISCPEPLRFSKLSVGFSNQVYNSHCQVSDGRGMTAQPEGELEPTDLYFVPGKLKIFAFSFLPQKEDVGRQIEITSVAVEMGGEGGRLAVLRWVVGGGELLGAVPQALALMPKRQTPSLPSLQWDHFDASSLIQVQAKPAMVGVELEHAPPSLLNEFYPLSLTLTNQEVATITALRLTVWVKNGETDYDPSTHISVDAADFDGQVVSCRSALELADLHSGQKATRVFYLKCIQSGSRSISAKVEYEVEVEVQGGSISCKCSKEETIILSTVLPFEVTTKLQSMKLELIDAVHAEEPFLLLPEVNCTSPWPLEICTSNVALSNFVKFAGEKHESQLEKVELRKAESAAECVCLLGLSCIQPSVTLGSYSLTWRRQRSGKQGPEVPYVTTSFPLPIVNIEHIPISVSLSLPAFGSVKTLLPLCYVIKNRTPYVQELEISMDPSDSFMFAGNKQVRFRVLPGLEYQQMYNLFPLVAGHVLLPKIHLNMLRYPGTMDDIVQKMLPSHIFIKPTGKTIDVPA